MRHILQKTILRILLGLLLVGMGWVNLRMAQAEGNNIPPVLFFSDLESGPKTGWGGSVTKGAAVTVWGKNFGSTRGTSYITVNGAQLTQDSDYAEWGVTTGNVRRLERITFWLNSNCQNGVGQITVTVGGVTSNALPFTVRNGTVYFVSQSEGNDSYNGLYETYKGGSNGPFATLGREKDALNPGDMLYVRAGQFTGNSGGAILYPKGGTAGNPIAYVAYPGEEVVIGNHSQYRCFWLWTGVSYCTIAKFIFKPSGYAIDSGSGCNHIRVVGNESSYATGDVGFCGPQNSYGWRILGNKVHDGGGDKLLHAIYLGGKGPNTYDHEIAWNEIYNQSEGRAIQIYGHQPNDYIGDVRIHDNLIYNIGRDGITIGGTDNPPIVLGTVEVYNNIIYNAGVDDNGSCLRIQGGGSGMNTGDFKVYNNTFYANSARPDDYPIRIEYPNSIALKNNIFYQLVPSSRYYEDTGDISRIDASNNLYYGAGNGPAWDINHVDADPQFVNLAGLDFHLQENSPAIDAGVNVGILTDYDGVTRPQGSGYDIGAYEYVVQAPVVRGDVNGDGVVNVVDVQLAVNQFLGVLPQTQEADLNGDGVVNVIDVQLLVNIILGG